MPALIGMAIALFVLYWVVTFLFTVSVLALKIAGYLFLTWAAFNIMKGFS